MTKEGNKTPDLTKRQVREQLADETDRKAINISPSYVNIWKDPLPPILKSNTGRIAKPSTTD